MPLRVIQVLREFILKDNILHISESGADTLQQQVERLDGNELRLSLLFQAVFSSGAQRETQMQLEKKKNPNKIGLGRSFQVNSQVKWDALSC